MSQYLLRIEAVDLRHFIYDTEKISVVRGGAFTILDAFLGLDSGHMKPDSGGEELAERWNLSERRPTLEVVSRGASSASVLVTVHPKDVDPKRRDRRIRRLCEEIRDWFRRDELFRYAHFVVDAVPFSPGQYRRASEESLALIRWRHMREAGRRVPETPSQLPSVKNGEVFCGADGVSPSAVQGMGTLLGASSAARRDKGIILRQKLVELVGGEGAGLEGKFTDELGELARRPGHSLDGKIAVLYADGNKFGALQRAACESPEAHERYDKALRGHRSGLIRTLFERLEDLCSTNAAAVTTEDGETRFETLLWGGDELRWVIPAWLGLEVAELFFSATKDWKVPIGEGEVPVSHAVGLVLCKAKAPISRIKDISELLAGEVKALLSTPFDGKEPPFDVFERPQVGDRLSYHVFESHDHLGAEFSRSRSEYRMADEDATGDARRWGMDLSLDGRRLSGLREAFDGLSKIVPRRRAHRIVREIRRGGVAGLSDPEAAWMEEARSVSESLSREQRVAYRSLLEQWSACASPVESQQDGDPCESATTWVHLNELWDYLER